MTGRVVAGALGVVGVMFVAARLSEMFSRATGTRIVTSPPTTPPPRRDGGVAP